MVSLAQSLSKQSQLLLQTSEAVKSQHSQEVVPLKDGLGGVPA